MNEKNLRISWYEHDVTQYEHNDYFLSHTTVGLWTTYVSDVNVCLDAICLMTKRNRRFCLLIFT